MGHEMKTKWLSALLVVLLAVLAPNQVSAQASRGSTNEEVRDPQQAELPGAQVTLKNEATGATASAVSGDSGQFNILDLSPGIYTLTAIAKGFSASTQHIAIDVGQTLALNPFAMAVSV